jgi:phosphoribosyl isomerase A
MSFTLLAAVEVAQGQTAILRRGHIQTDRSFGDPVADAEAWVGQGAKWLHLVDLDGVANRDLLHDVIRVVKGKAAIEYVGGVRTDSDVQWARSVGVDRVVLDLTADPAWLTSQFHALKHHCSVLVPIHRDRVQCPGSDLDGEQMVTAAAHLRQRGCPSAVVRDVDHEGTRRGPQLPLLTAFAEELGAPVIAAGVAGSLDHVRELAKAARQGISAVVLDAGLYKDYFSVAEAVAALEARFDPYQWGPAQPWGMTGTL